ncbi:phage tail family protein [Gemella sp. GH3]|uniref:distal tail protein Dit n=1 Tax=unclassified Gemella TaxID=2624949 RepID=UPI0015D04F7F|nr:MULTISPECIES: distal tail protein Dit [unclassified Gemella]MBF0714489.1 phage tail family protein [Gemella sp. GH3.1]NYS51441.1 phage tail family protein [Gemella sp. GH3]
MTFYNFIDTTQSAIINSYANKLHTSFNGKVLDREVPYFKTLTVQGRTLIGREVQTASLPGRDGAVILDNKLPLRNILLKYQIDAPNTAEYRRATIILNNFLHFKEECSLIFSDEPNYYFKAIVTNVSDLEEVSNSMVGTITFTCYDPWKYSTSENINKTSTGSINVDFIPLELVNVDFVPELITVKVKDNVSKVIIYNNSLGLKIVINGTFVVNDVIHIRLNEEYPVTINGKGKTEWIDFIETDFDFYIKNGNTISVTPYSSELTISIKGKAI